MMSCKAICSTSVVVRWDLEGNSVLDSFIEQC